MSEETMIMDELKALSKKVDAIPEVVRAEVRSEVRNFSIQFGLDPDKPLETQEAVAWLKRRMRDYDQVHTKKIDVFAGWAYRAIIVAVIGGLFVFYTQSLVSTAVKKEMGLIDNRRKVEQVVKKDVQW